MKMLLAISTNCNKDLQLAPIKKGFESLKSLAIARNKHLSEQYFVDSFMSGLKDEIRMTVQMFGPKILTHDFSLAKLQEAALDNARKNKLPSKFNNYVVN